MNSGQFLESFEISHIYMGGYGDDVIGHDWKLKKVQPVQILSRLQ